MPPSIKRRKFNRYIDNLMENELRLWASELQKRFLGAMVTVFNDAAGPSQSAAAGINTRDKTLRKWKLEVQAAFGEVLKLRASMAKSSITYGFRFPGANDRFEDWMEPAHLNTNTLPKNDKVYLCMRPAVFSQDKYRGNTRQTLVSPALVMLEGRVPDLTMS